MLDKHDHINMYDLNYNGLPNDANHHNSQPDEAQYLQPQSLPNNRKEDEEIIDEAQPTSTGNSFGDHYQRSGIVRTERNSNCPPFFRGRKKKDYIIIALTIALLVFCILLAVTFASKNDVCTTNSDISPSIGEWSSSKDWSSWDTCSACGTQGTQHRIRLCTASERHNTSFCPHGWLRQTQNCTDSNSERCPSASVCYDHYLTLTESYRRESVGGGGNCDRDKIDGTSWYRFRLETGENGVLDHCPEHFKCGTELTIWMNGSHPTESGVIKHVTMGASLGGNCFYSSGFALVTKCNVDGDVFYLYKLWRLSRCDSSYCSGLYSIH